MAPNVITQQYQLDLISPAKCHDDDSVSMQFVNADPIWERVSPRDRGLHTNIYT